MVERVRLAGLVQLEVGALRGLELGRVVELVHRHRRGLRARRLEQRVHRRAAGLVGPVPVLGSVPYCFDFEGKYYTVADARVSEPPDPLPQIYFGGSSAAALPIAAEYVDVYLTWGEGPHAAAAKVEQVRGLADQRGRNVRFGIRLHTISRDTSAAAWAVADELLADLPWTRSPKPLSCMLSRSRKGSGE